MVGFGFCLSGICSAWLWLISGWFWFDCFAGFGFGVCGAAVVGKRLWCGLRGWCVNFCSLQGLGVIVIFVRLSTGGGFRGWRIGSGGVF